jgi:hypothetical protein
MKISVTRFSNERNSILSQTLAVSRLKTSARNYTLLLILDASKLRTREKSCIHSQTLAVSRLRTSARNYTLLLILDASKLRINKGALYMSHASTDDARYWLVNEP